MQTKNKKAKVEKKELLDLNENIIATSVFKLKKFEMDENMVWSMKLVLKTQLPQSFREYKIKLSLNEQPYNVRIDDLNRKHDAVEAEQQLDFVGNKKTQLKNILEEIADVEAELAKALKDAPVIEFHGIIEKLEYKDGDTVIVLSFPALSITELNENRRLLKDYKIELIRE